MQAILLSQDVGFRLTSLQEKVFSEIPHLLHLSLLFAQILPNISLVPCQDIKNEKVTITYGSTYICLYTVVWEHINLMKLLMKNKMLQCRFQQGNNYRVV